MIRLALHLRYTSFKAYKLLLEKCPLPSVSLLNKIQEGGVDASKAVRLLEGGVDASNKGCTIIASKCYILGIINRIFCKQWQYLMEQPQHQLKVTT